MPTLEEYVDEIRGVWDSAWLTNMGVKHEELAGELRALLQVPYVSLFTNGHMALEMALQAMKLHGEVITTPFTFASTVHAIKRNGLTPVFCDINADNYTIDVTKIENKITEKTCAIVPVHVYGNICDVEKIQEIADKHHLKVLYDGAHAFSETYKGQSVGTFGDATMFSFHATKVFNTIEGGAVTTVDECLYRKMNQLKNFGIAGEEVVDEVGGNAKMNEFQAAMGICNLRHLHDEINKRRKVVERYRENLSGISGIKLCQSNEDTESNYAYFPILLDPEVAGTNRNQVYDMLKEHDIYARKYFYPLANDYDCYNSVYSSKETPVAKKIADTVLTLPLYADLELEMVDKICELIVREICTQR
jgi:dTDP-4-amino-4,6-dideoxygalactose transaminase